jgi:hypothetical protein
LTFFFLPHRQAKRGEGRFPNGWVFSIMDSLVIVFMFVGLFTSATVARAEEKMTIGQVEEVVLLPWGVKLLARIDTGAATSSLDARDLRIKENIAEFKLAPKYGDLQFRLPVVDWKHIRSSEARERRPVVEMELCFGPKRIRAKVNLNDRSMVKYPLIIGRNILREDFVVDCKQSHCLSSPCPEVFSK